MAGSIIRQYGHKCPQPLRPDKRDFLGELVLHKFMSYTTLQEMNHCDYCG